MPRKKQPGETKPETKGVTPKKPISSDKKKRTARSKQRVSYPVPTKLYSFSFLNPQPPAPQYEDIVRAYTLSSLKGLPDVWHSTLIQIMKRQSSELQLKMKQLEDDKRDTAILEEERVRGKEDRAHREKHGGLTLPTYTKIILLSPYDMSVAQTKKNENRRKRTEARKESTNQEKEQKEYTYQPYEAPLTADSRTPLYIHPEDYYNVIGTLTSTLTARTLPKEIHPSKTYFKGTPIEFKRVNKKAIDPNIIPTPQFTDETAAQLIAMDSMRMWKNAQIGVSSEVLRTQEAEWQEGLTVQDEENKEKVAATKITIKGTIKDKLPDGSQYDLSSAETKNNDVRAKLEKSEEIQPSAGKIAKLVIKLNAEKHIYNDTRKPQRKLNYSAGDTPLTESMHNLLREMEHHDLIVLDEKAERRVGPLGMKVMSMSRRNENGEAIPVGFKNTVTLDTIMQMAGKEFFMELPGAMQRQVDNQITAQKYVLIGNPATPQAPSLLTDMKKRTEELCRKDDPRKRLVRLEDKDLITKAKQLQTKVVSIDTHTRIDKVTSLANNGS
jgi:hypothetical protein